MNCSTSSEQDCNFPIWKVTIEMCAEKVVPNIKYELQNIGNYCVSSENILIDECIPECLLPPNDKAINGITEIGKRVWEGLNEEKWNLHKDFEHWQEPSPTDHIKSFHTSWLMAKNDESGGKMLRDADIVCCSGILGHIIESQSKNDFSWNVSIIRLTDSNTLIFHKTKSSQNNPPREEMLRFMYYGTHFEFIMTGFSWRENHRHKFLNVVNGQLGDLKLLLCGNVDGTLTSSDGQKKCVEFRTRTVQSKSKEFNWQKFRARSWWSHCYFVGTPIIIVGFYDRKNGQVKSIKELPVKEVIRSSSRHWNEKESLSFLYDILSAIKKIAEEKLDSPEKVLVCNGKNNAGRVTLSFELFESGSCHNFLSKEELNKLINV